MRLFRAALLPWIAAGSLLPNLAGGVPAWGAPARQIFSQIPAHDALTPDQWERIDRSVHAGLRYLASQQAPDGSFPSSIAGQPAVTSLGVMAFLSRGYRPGQSEQPYGEVLERAIEYVMSVQEPSGLLTSEKQDYGGAWVNERRPHTATYNHAISGLMLGEAYGQSPTELNKRIRPTIHKALRWARQMQQRPPKYPEDAGGWRYLHIVRDSKPRSDLSATGWLAMFYRSARNAEFDVPQRFVDDAADFTERCFDTRSGAFVYGPTPSDYYLSRGMTGAGLLVLTVSGRRDEQIARRAGQWLLDHPFNQYGATLGRYDRYHYGAYYCSQAMYLLGGDYWSEFYQQLARSLTTAQLRDGGWPLEPTWGDHQWGRCYTTSLGVLALTPPYQMLPIYQR